MFKAKIFIQRIESDSRAMVLKGDWPHSEPLGEKWIKKSDKISLKGWGEEWVVEVREVNKDKVDLYTQGLIVGGLSKGTITKPEPTGVTLKIGGLVDFVTPGFDAHLTWRVKLLACEPSR